MFKVTFLNRETILVQEIWLEQSFLNYTLKSCHYINIIIEKEGKPSSCFIKYLFVMALLISNDFPLVQYWYI